MKTNKIMRKLISPILISTGLIAATSAFAEYYVVDDCGNSCCGGCGAPVAYQPQVVQVVQPYYPRHHYYRPHRVRHHKRHYYHRVHHWVSAQGENCVTVTTYSGWAMGPAFCHGGVVAVPTATTYTSCSPSYGERVVYTASPVVEFVEDDGTSLDRATADDDPLIDPELDIDK